MAMVKIINKNFPDENSYAQINYDNGQQLGVGDIGDLYTLVDEYDINEDKITLYPDGDRGGDLWMYKNSSIEIVTGLIMTTGVNYNVRGHSSYGVGFAIYLFDDRNTPEIKNASGNSLRNLIGEGNGICSGPHCLYRYNDGNNYVPNNTNIGYIHDVMSSYMDNLKVTNIPGNPLHGGNSFTPIKNDLPLFSQDISEDSDSSFYIVVRCFGDAEDWEPYDRRNRSYTKYKLPKKLLRDMWLRGRGYKNKNGEPWEVFGWGPGMDVDDVHNGETITTKIGNNPSYSTDNYGEGDEYFDVSATAFKCYNFAIKVTPPQWSINDIPPYKPIEYDSYPDSGDIGWKWIKTDDNNDHIYLRPDNLIDYTNVFVDDDDSENILLDTYDIFNYRPISFVTVQSPNSDVDLQSWYDFGTDGFIWGAAPNIVKLSFQITNFPKANDFTIEYYSYNNTTYTWYFPDNTFSRPDMGFKFFVVDWDSPDVDIDWYDIINDLPNNYTELYDKQSIFNAYRYTDVTSSDGSYNYASHEYNSAGIKNIKVLMFSYIKHSEDTRYIQALRWKALNVRINLNYDTNILEDFADIGGADFTYIPWPETNPVIGGLSSESGYVNSIENIISENKFDDTELSDYYRTLVAYNNRPGGNLDELGRSIGKSDIAQFRYFKDGSYDMNNLLGLSNQVIDINGDNLYSYDNFDHWGGDPCIHDTQYNCTNFPTYPTDSCVGLIFINDSMRQDLKNDCEIEFNSGETFDDFVSDSNGNDIKGILMGDYNLKKSNYGEPISRISSPIIPGIDNKDGAF